MNKKKLDNLELSSFFKNIAVMMKAGISIGEAVRMLCDDPSDGNRLLDECLRVISAEMKQGSPFIHALEKTGAFPDYSLRMIRASENTGNLEKTLNHLGDYYQNEEEIERALLSAVRYPISLLSMIIILLAVMLWIVLPAFQEVYSNLAGSLTEASFRYMHSSVLLCEILLAVMIVFVVLLIIGMILWKKGRKKGIRKVLGKISELGSVISEYDLYRFTFCFHMYLTSGWMQEEAFKFGMEVVETDALRKSLSACLADMEAGKSFSQAVFTHHIYDPTTNRILIPAERSGSLDDVLVDLCDSLKKSSRDKVDKVANTIEPVLTGLLLISVGLMMISLIIPLIGIMNSIG